MKRSRFGWKKWAFALVIFATCSVRAEAGLIAEIEAIVNGVGNAFVFDYKLTNDPMSTLGASSLFLSVSGDAALFDITAPAGWDVFYLAGDPTIEFASSSPMTDIAPGAVGMFSIRSLFGPGMNDSLIRGFDEVGGGFLDIPGQVLTPSAVPEPSSFVLGLVAAGGLAAIVRRRRRLG
ncbi:MAG: PEP-CTERM sorting domain-containing protein [Isosphaeraceae bacterium]|nr:PEP-CTERM sorting domain-containing protein [Isosphaeraceae bacterium]